MIDVKTLKELVRLMVDNDLAEIDLRDENETVTLKRAGAAPPTFAVAPAHHHHAAPPQQAPAPQAAAAAPAKDDNEGLIPIESPMVGTFYSAPDPDSPPFVTSGKRIGRDDVVCLIEAMKVFNEIKGEVAGVVEKILVENGQAVEYGQPLFLVRAG